MADITTHLGQLQECTTAFRLRREEPVVAYWAVLLDEDGATLHLHLQNLRPLAGDDAYVYQPWLAPPDGVPVPLPPFNTSLPGAGFCTIRSRRADAALGPGAQLIVTAEPRRPHDEPAPRVLEGPWAELDRTAGAAPPTSDLPEAADLFLRQTPPAIPVLAAPPGYEALEQVQGALTPAHDLARGGTGAVVFDFSRDVVVISLDDMPTPDAFGHDPVTTRPFNVYAGWLLRREAADRAAAASVVPLGFFRRAGAGSYRLQARGAAHLTDYDLVLVSAEDRAGAFDPLERQVFSTPYSAFVPMAAEATET